MDSLTDCSAKAHNFLTIRNGIFRFTSFLAPFNVGGCDEGSGGGAGASSADENIGSYSAIILINA